MNKCPIWQIPARVISRRGDSFRVESPRTCGTYIISRTAAVTVGNYSIDQRISLTSWLIRQRMRGNDEPMIYSYSKFPLSRLQPYQRADNLLKYINSQLPRISDVFEFKRRHQFYPQLGCPLWERYAEMLAWSESTELGELEDLLTFLETNAWLEKAYLGAEGRNFRLTVAGRGHLAELNYQSGDST